MQNVSEKFGDCIAESITPAEIERWLDSRADWKISTKNRHIAFLKLAYRLAERAGTVKVNPMRLVQQRQENNARIRWLTDAEEHILRAEIQKGAPDRMVDFEFALNTGVRQSEQYGITRERVDLLNGIITIPRSKNGRIRHVPMNSRTRAILEMLVKDIAVNDNVFPPTSLYWFQAAVKRARLMDFSWHSLRHTFASRLVMAGVDIRTVQELMGHQSIVMTMRYSHLARRIRRRQLNGL